MQNGNHLRNFYSLVNSYFLHSALFIALSIGSLGLYAQVDFTADTTSGCNPLLINFQDLSVNAVAWNWNFGNGSTSTLQNPGLIYNTPGTYTVTLTATLANGTTQTETKTNYITVNEQPTADFSASATNVCLGESIQFTDLTQSATPIGSWLWDFGDGNTSTLQNPTHTYTLPGDYTVTLVIVNAANCTDLLVQTDFISIEALPNAAISANNTIGCTPPLAVQFNASNPPGSVHSWDFGDGTNSTLPNPAHSYNSNGSFTVTHIVTTPLGCTDTVVETNLIDIGQPTASLQVTSNTICPNGSVGFVCGLTNLTSINWDFGDGSTLSGSCNPTHAYSTPGLYNVSATMIDNSGCTINATTSITVALPPVADFSSPDTFLCDGTTATFTANTPSAVTWAWDFGDNTTGAGSTVSHTYAFPGIYTVTLLVTDGNGCTDFEIKPAYIVIDTIEANIMTSVDGGCEPVSIDFFDFSSAPTNAPLTNWTWNFGDGTSSNLPNPTHVYADSGTYEATLIVSNALGCIDSVKKLIRVGTPPIPNFTGSPLIACPLDTVFLTNLSTNYTNVRWDWGDGSETSADYHVYGDTGLFDVQILIENNGCEDSLLIPDYVQVLAPSVDFLPSQLVACDTPVTIQLTDLSYMADSWSWDFGNGTTSTLQNPSVTFANSGEFPIVLTVTNNSNGCIDSIVRNVVVRPTFADLTTPGSTIGCNPHTVLFSDQSASDIDIWLWDFGDGSFQTIQSPGHIYNTAGIFDVSLTVVNDVGCIDSVTYPNYITVAETDASFSPSTTSGCLPLSVQFTNTTSSILPVQSYSWDFGDGTSSTAINPSHTYTSQGQFTVTLQATDTLGCTSSFSINIDASEIIPLVDISDTVGCIGNPIIFSDSTLGSNLFYTWDFGDGNSVPLSNTTHAYTANGSYTASINIQDPLGCDTTITQTIVIADPQINFSANNTSANCPPLLVNFSSTAVSPHTFVSWEWDFGNGTSSTQPNPSIVYTLPGSYHVTLIGTTASGCTDTLVIPDYIQIGGPTGSFTMNPTNFCLGDSVTLIATATQTSSYEWDMDDGNILLDSVITHTYTTPGVYYPQVFLEDGTGCRVLVGSNDSIVVYPNPSADYSALPTTVCDSGTVQFTDISTVTGGSITSWEWDFGDGGNDIVQNPSHFYNQVGSYDIQLIVQTPEGCTDTLTQPNGISVVSAPIVEMSLSDTLGCAPFVLSGNDISPITNAPIVSWLWDWGSGGATSSTPSASFTYNTAGSYMVSLSLTDVNGCTASTQQTIEAVTAPTPNFESPDTVGCAPLTVQFTDLSTGGIAWLWDFGDGTIDSVQNPTHIYSQDGLYTVSLTVTDVNGCVDSTRLVDYVDLALPTADFNAMNTQHCDSGTVSFTDLSSANSAIVGWEWDFGDGNTSLNQNPTHTYTQTGSFSVQLVITTTQGCTDTLIRNAEVAIRPSPIAAIAAIDSANCAPFSANFLDVSPSTNNPIQSWLWDFDDASNTSTLQNPAYTYTSAGSYTISLNITDTFGCTGDTSFTLTVYPLPNPNFTIAPDSFGCAPINLSFTDLTPNAQAWQWNFGDGSTANTSNPTHLYTQDSLYDVSLVVTDVNGCVDSLTKSQYIRLSHPNAAMAFSPFILCPNETVNVSDFGTTSDTNIVAWNWTFGDGNSSTQQSPSHTYTQSGSYDLTLIVTDAFGCKDTVSSPNIISVVSDDILSAPITYVTVQSDGTVRVNYLKSNDPSFKSYHIYRQTNGGTFQLIHSSNDNTEVSFLDTGLDTRINTYCYKVTVENTCDQETDLADVTEHCAITLTASTPLPQSIQLNWTAYEGWDIAQYEIYRVNGYSLNNPQWVATVDGNTLSFEDTSIFCATTYTYRIAAVQNVTNPLRSYSNIDHATSTQAAPPTPMPLTRVTVLEDRDVFVEWDSIPDGDKLADIVLTKRTGNATQQILQRSVNHPNLYYIDTDVLVDEQSYTYHLFVMDSCGSLSPIGRRGETMLLGAERTQGSIALSWSPYSEWEQGVAFYRIEVYNESLAAYETVADVPSTTTQFVDKQTDLNQAEYCYRIHAFELLGRAAFSTSNESCVSLDPIWFAPSAFSPNDDGTNDVFFVKGAFFEQFRMQIYNRWGKLIFESASINEGWDGTYKNQAVPEGVYMFRITAQTSSGQPISRTGSITLIR